MGVDNRNSIWDAQQKPGIITLNGLEKLSVQ